MPLFYPDGLYFVKRYAEKHIAYLFFEPINLKGMVMIEIQPVAVLTRYSHYFTVRKISKHAVRAAVEGVFGQFAHWGFGRRADGSFGRMILKHFALRMKEIDGTVYYRFHINSWHTFCMALDAVGFTKEHFTIVDAPLYTPQDATLAFGSPHTPRDDQEVTHEYLLADAPVSKLVIAQTGKGKALSMNAFIKIPGGWKRNGDMKVGDIVTAKDGSPTEVTGVYPQGKVRLYRVTFADGREVDCCAEHLWRVYYVNTVIARRWRIANTLEVLRLISMPNPRVYIDLIDPEDGADSEFTLDPYVLGVYLGDGCSANNTTITNPDQFIADEVSRLLPSSIKLRRHNAENRCPTYGIVNKIKGMHGDFKEILKEMGLDGKLSYEKFVPKEYMHGSRQQRLALLQGLLDTDGTVDSVTGTVSYTTTSLDLSYDIEYLARSLGAIVTTTMRYTFYPYAGEKRQGRLTYTAFIRHKTPSELFRLPRKKEKTNDNNQYAKDLKLRVTGVEYIGMGDAQCISIAHPDKLYVTNDFIVTHNTFVAARALCAKGKRILVVIRPKYIEKWEEDLHQLCGIAQDRIKTITGSKELRALLTYEPENLPYDAVIISNRTLQRWLSKYIDRGEKLLDDGYAITPDKFCERIGSNGYLVDERHQDFHLQFLMDMFTHAPETIGLTATLISDDPFIAKMQMVLHPFHTRAKKAVYHVYTRVSSFHYWFKQPSRIRLTQYGSTNYSHTAFEDSVMRDKEVCLNYFAMIRVAVERYWNNRYKKEGDRCLVFFATVEMCEKFVKYIKAFYPNHVVNKFTEGDPYENLITSDLAVSTVISAGTAHDIAQLTAVIMSLVLRSSSSNWQVLGRLRDLKDGRNPYFVYLVGEDFGKHIDVHLQKQELFLSEKLPLFSYAYGPRL